MRPTICEYQTAKRLAILVALLDLASGFRRASSRPRPGVCPKCRRRPRPVSTATSWKTRGSISSGATASTIGRMSAALSATWPRKANPMPSSMKGNGLRRSSHPKTAPVATFSEGEEFAHSHHSKGGPHSRLAGQCAGRGRRRQSRYDYAGVSIRQQRRSRSRLLAVSWQRSEGAARWQAGSRHLAEHGDRAHQSRWLGRILLCLPQPPFVLRLPGTAPRQLRQVPHGTRSSPDGDLLRIEARHRVPRVQGQAEHGLGQMGRRRGL